MTEKKVVNLNYPPKDMPQEEVEELIGDLSDEDIQESKRIAEVARQRIRDGKGRRPPSTGGE